MKLLRYGPRGQEKPGLLDTQGKIRDLSGVVPDIAGDTLLPPSLDRLRRLTPEELPLAQDGARLGACVGRVGKFLCVGLNYSDHAAESNMAVPAEPIIFMKATSSISGPNDDVVIPRGSQKSDWEVELGVVIGAEAKYVAEADAMNHVAGYCLVNDLSERAFQLEGTGQWVKGKSADTFGPIGPWLVTTDELARLAGSQHVARGRRPSLSAGLDEDDGVRRAVSGQLLEQVHEPAAGRRDLDWHTAGSRARSETTGLPACR